MIKDPVLFSGTLRMNLDPFEEYEDHQIWKVLENTHLKNFVSNLEGNLKFKCLNGGDNLR
jgi:ATP-binding cassette, subfamily C (CFTR/MRP), member 1